MWTQETIMKKIKENPLFLILNGKGRPEYKKYKDEYKGVPIDTLWCDINNVQGTSSENTRYPTQKPIDLLKRIITITTNENDLVIDLYSGSGTTALACQELNRDYIGCDISESAINLTKMRLGLLG